MATIITRLYADGDTAADAVAALKAEEYLDRDIDVVSGDDRAAAEQQARQAGVYRAAAATYAGYIAEGHTLLVLRAPLGHALRAEPILDAFPSIATDVKHKAVFTTGTMTTNTIIRGGSYRSRVIAGGAKFLSGSGNPARMSNKTPFSSMFRMPATIAPRRAKLISHNKTFFSKMLFLPLTIKPKSTPSVIRRR